MKSTLNSRLVAVRLGDTLVGIDLDRVEEVARLQEVTSVNPSSPAVHGIANLRGSLLTLIDLGQVLYGSQLENHRHAINVIVSSENESVGLVAHELAGVFDTAELIEQQVPTQLQGTREGLIQSIVQLETELLLVLDLDAVLRASKA